MLKPQKMRGHRYGYAAEIRSRARDGVASHGSLHEYVRDFRASYKLFEMVTAERMARERGRAFHLWEDVALEVKDAHGLPHPDVGIDVTDATTAIVQCKLRARTLTWSDCSTFLACAVDRRAHASGLCVPWSEVIIARNACSRLSAHCAFFAAKLGFDRPVTLEEVEATVAELLLDDSADRIEPGASAPVVAAAALRDFQLEALELCTKETAREAYVVLPTGCGKSLVMARVAAFSEEIRVLILVPLVVLLEQILAVLAANGCASVAAVGGGHVYDPAAVDAARVVVCVYNSAHQIDAESFGRVLVDEAHFARAPAMYTDLISGEAGEAGEAQEAGEAGEAQEAQEAQEAREHGEDGCFEYAGSSEESTARASRRGDGYAAVRAMMRLASARLFSATLDVPEGAERCTRTLRAMIDAGFICDYRLNVPVFDVGATNADLARCLVRNYRSIIVFCAARAEGLAFCAAMNDFGPCARYIDCETGRGERGEVLAAFKRGELAFIVNVRVLSVGFDAPITKGVCFVHMPASKTHIVQVIGRCLRVHPGKRCAQVILPLVAGADGEDMRARDFMRVLALNDESFASALRNGGGARVAVRAEGAASAAHDAGALAPAVDLLYNAVYDAMGKSLHGAWDARFAELLAYHAEHATPPPHGAPRGLGVWVKRQRNGRDTMAPERAAKLDALPWWAWNTRDDTWNARFSELVAYHRERACIPVCAASILGRWVSAQRANRDTMTPERKEKLDALPWWVWRVNEVTEWDARFAELVSYHDEHGSIPVGARGLPGWVQNQRALRGKMPLERKERLEALPWWSWNTLDDAWNTHFAELVAYYARNGRIPEGSVPGLGSWVTVQRTRRGKMPPERTAKLEALGWWVWSERSFPGWESQYRRLVSYYAEHGCVPPNAGTGAIGKWVSTQRKNRDTMTRERKAKLDALPWWVWGERDRTDWETSYTDLVAYHTTHGSLPPRDDSAKSGNPSARLGKWVSHQRAKCDTMAPERKAKLEALPWWSWNTLEDTWAALYAELVAHYAEHGRIPICASRLGNWVCAQRTRREVMTPQRRAKLEELPWWVWRVTHGRGSGRRGVET